jgi:hypothetical protein
LNQLFYTIKDYNIDLDHVYISYINNIIDILNINDINFSETESNLDTSGDSEGSHQNPNPNPNSDLESYPPISPAPPKTPDNIDIREL